MSGPNAQKAKASSSCVILLNEAPVFSLITIDRTPWKAFLAIAMNATLRRSWLIDMDRLLDVICLYTVRQMSVLIIVADFIVVGIFAARFTTASPFIIK